MIVGNGDIASVLTDRDDRTYFVSGVSNSSEDRAEAFNREIDLLRQQQLGKHLVYCSSLSVFYSETPYAKHKRSMEELVRRYFTTYTILRIGNIDWGTNPHTIINFLRNQYRTGKPLEIRDVFRYVVNKEEFLYWIGMIPEWSCEMNVPGRRMSVQEIVEEYVFHQEG